MKYSYRWLAEMAPGLRVEPAELKGLITIKTAECEGIERWGEALPGIVAARVVSAQPIGNGRNKKVVIDAGAAGLHTVVCGAPNVAVGMMAAWAPPGTTLEGRQIGVAEISGVESEGMLASGEELGINRDGDGLMMLDRAAPGEGLRGVEPDWVIEIDNKSLTHRPDLWGHYGMAREVAAIVGLPLKDPVDSALLPAGRGVVQAEIEDYALAARYSALVFEGVEVKASPLWLQARLQSLGMNPINNIVDVTNYILAELPQPTHAFDADKLAGSTIFVRRARAGERLKALNGETYELTGQDLVIADGGGPVALAGVIGGADSAISAQTRRVVLESANFAAAGVRLTSSRHKLRTDASIRFEKALDPENTVRGLARAVALLQEVCPGVRVVGGVTDTYRPPAKPGPIRLPAGFVARRLGKAISEEQVAEILGKLGFGIERESDGGLSVRVPSWRATKDISLKEDLVEEVGRMVGYGEITPRPPLVPSVAPPESAMRLHLRKLRRGIAAQGFTEVYSYSFVNEAQWKRFGLREEDHLKVLNPIAAELTHMRRKILPGLFDAVIKNTRHYREFRLFEIGREIDPRAEGLPEERNRLVAAMYGAHADRDEFFELKRVLECVFPEAELRQAAAYEWEHPARAAEIRWRGLTLGRLFELHPALLEAEKVEGRAFLFDTDIDLALTRAGQTARYVPVRRYPTSAFDLSVIAALRTPVAEIEDELKSLGGDRVVSIEFVRQYAGPPLEAGEKSVSYRVELGADDRTLTSEEASHVRTAMIEGMRRAGFELRV